MDSDNQIFVPASFIALYSDERGRLREAPDTVRERYELCEDLACSLVERAQALYHEAPSEAGVLHGIHAAVASPATGLTPAEARWVVLRLAELLGWRAPDELSRP
ncbi:MAG: hypothetical protein OZ923_10555 [Comamonadaceae bacterium]|nr:hypothetical protein [Comamonadaceae bacterium]